MELFHLSRDITSHQRPRKSAGGLEGAVNPPWGRILDFSYSGRLELLLWCSIRVYVEIGVVGGRGYYCLNFPFSIRLKILAKKYCCWNICRGGGGGLEPPKPPSGSAPAHNTCAHCNKALFIPSIKSSSYGNYP